MKIVLILLTIIFSWTISIAQKSSVMFLLPEFGVTITSNSCTLSVASHPEIKAVSFTVYYHEHKTSDIQSLLLGRVAQKPYRIVWNLDKIPNQLTSGAAISADVEFLNGSVETIHREGIFLAHKIAIPSKAVVPFGKLEKNGVLKPTVKFENKELNSVVEAFIAWKKDDLQFYITVKNPYFYSTLSSDKLEQMGVKICIDPLGERKAYLTESIYFCSVPLKGEANIIKMSSHYTSNGDYVITKKRELFNGYNALTFDNFNGYVVEVSIPVSVFGEKFPDTIMCNIIANIVDKNDVVVPLSWANWDKNTILSPYVYGELKILKKPFFTNPIIIWSVAFSAGVISGLLALFMIFLGKKLSSLNKFENSEQEQFIISNIKVIMDAEIFNQDFGLDSLAQKLSMPQKFINKLFKKYYEKNFTTFLLSARLEIAKERLRSSNSSEISIAKSCGFKSVNDMEKQFRKMWGINPFRYREEYRVLKN